MGKNALDSKVVKVEFALICLIQLIKLIVNHIIRIVDSKIHNQLA